MSPAQHTGPDDARNTSPVTDKNDDLLLERIVLIFLILFLVALIVVPSEWFLKLSMWWNGIQ